MCDTILQINIHISDAAKDSYLLYEQLLAHGDALVEPLLVFLQESLLLVNLSPQITIRLQRKDGDHVNADHTIQGKHVKWCSSKNRFRLSGLWKGGPTLSRSSIRPSFFSRSRLLLLSRAASFRPVSSV